MRATFAILAAMLLAACSTQQVAQTQADADAAVTSAQPTIAMACWLIEAADAGFQAYAAGDKADAAVAADEAKAIAAAHAICANPPADLAQAIGDVLASYKEVVAATPAAKAGS